jgi:hypothetical protein
MTDTDIHSCGYYCDRPLCIKAQRNELRDKFIATIPTPMAEPEPFEYWNAVDGWVKIDEMRQHFDTAGCGTIYKHEGEGRIPLYAAPPQREWVGLTDEEMFAALVQVDPLTKRLAPGFEYFARAIETKLREKNT